MGFFLINPFTSRSFSWTNWNTTHDGAETDSGGAITNSRVRVIKLSAENFLAVWSNSTTCYGVVITTSGTTPNHGTVTSLFSFDNATILSLSIYPLDSTRAIICYSDSNNGHLKGRVLSISGTSISAGTEKDMVSALCVGGRVLTVDTDKVVVIWKESSIGKAAITTISSTTINNLGATFTWEASAIDSVSDVAACVLASDSVLVAYGIVPAVKARILSIGSSTITAPTATKTINTTNLPVSVGRIQAGNITSEKAVVSYNVSAANALKGIPLDISGTTITERTEATIHGANIISPLTGTGLLPLNTTQVMAIFGLASNGYPQANAVTVGSSLSPSTTRQISANDAGSNGTFDAVRIDANRVLYCYYRGAQLYSKVLLRA